MSEVIEMPEMPSFSVKEYMDDIERRLCEEMAMPVSLKRPIGRSSLADAINLQHRFNQIIDAQYEYLLSTLPEFSSRRLLA